MQILQKTSNYSMLTRAIVPPCTVGKSSLAPRKVACTAPGLPTTRVAGPVILKVSVLPARIMRDTSGVVPRRRISTQESCSSFSTSAFSPAAAAAGGVTAAATAAGAGGGAAGTAAAGTEAAAEAA